MDNLQPTTNNTIKKKRGSSQVNPVQAHSMEITSIPQEEEQAMSKRRKQETDPLKMNHVLEKVFGFLDIDSIKAARQSNTLWSVEGAKSLISKYYVKIPSEIQTQDSSTKNIMMEKFKIFLSHKSKDSPVIPNIIVAAIDDVGHWKSLGVLGYQVKSLKFKCMDERAKLLRNLLNFLPKLKYLDLKGLQFSKYIISIIIDTMSKKERVGSPLLISMITLKPQSTDEGLEAIENFADCKNVMTEGLQLDYYRPHQSGTEVRIANALSKLLSTSQTVIKYLALNNCEYYLKLLEFPFMTELTYIFLNFLRGSPQLTSYNLSPSFRFSEKVPNLRGITFFFPGGFSDFLQNLLENTGTAPSIKRVHCIGRCVNFDIDTLFKTFPNTEELQVAVNSNSEYNFRSLWTHGKNLQKLTLLIDWSLEMGDFPDPDLLFTGFDAETMNKIKETPNLDPYTLEQLEELRVNPSISNLKELEQLSIHFRYMLPECVPKRMLTVTAKYEINQLPKNPQIFINSTLTPAFRGAFEEVSILPNFHCSV